MSGVSFPRLVVQEINKLTNHTFYVFSNDNLVELMVYITVHCFTLTVSEISASTTCPVGIVSIHKMDSNADQGQSLIWTCTSNSGRPCNSTIDSLRIGASANFPTGIALAIVEFLQVQIANKKLRSY